MSAPVPLRLRPLEIGDLLDEIFRIYRRNFLPLAGLSIGFSILLSGLSSFGLLGLYGTLLDQSTSGNPLDLSTLSPYLTAIGVGIVINLALLPLMYGSVTAVICDAALGRPFAWRRVVGMAFRRYLHVAGYVYLLVLMGVAFCLFPLWIWIAVGWAAVLPVMFVENVGLVDAMRRSWRLVQRSWWRTFFLLFLVFVLYYVVTLALQAYFGLGQFILTFFLSQYVILLLSGASSILVGGLVIPILQIALVLIYFDLRVRKEGLDLFQLAQRISGPPPALA
jgi:hypothetical protein